MNIYINKSFSKDIEKIKDKKVRSRIVDCIQYLQNAESLQDIKGLTKIKTTNSLYRLWIGDYRIGLE